jgi:mono/diheme cytochrome c family protein
MRALRCALAVCALTLSAGGHAQLYGPMSSRPAAASVPAAGGGAQAGGTATSAPAVGTATSAPAGGTAMPAPAGEFDVEKLFANTCGWCHSGGGRVAGRGPQLMDSKLSDAELIHRIKAGKAGAMPSFATAFTEDQMKAIVKYIRELKPEGAAK